MDIVLLIKAAVMGVVEGLTEFLPVSSTGHLILTSSLLGLANDEIMKTFEVVIQSGAILAIVIVYWQLIVKSFASFGSDPKARRLIVNIVVGFLPAAVIGFLMIKVIKQYLFNGPVVGGAFIVGALIILWVERGSATRRVRVHSIDEMTTADALKVGFIQCLGMIPGTSRSGSTIIGGMLVGLSRQVATEFSFFLAIPTMLGATTVELWKNRHALSGATVSWGLIGVGFVVAFFVALVVIRWFVGVVSKHGFQPFAWYRIIAGGAALIWLLAR